MSKAVEAITHVLDDAIQAHIRRAVIDYWEMKELPSSIYETCRRLKVDVILATDTSLVIKVEFEK